MTWAIFLRIASVLGCAVALWFLSSAAFRQYKDWNRKTRDHWWALTGWVFLGFEGPIETLIQGNPPGPRVIIQGLVVALTIRALARKDELRADASLPWKKDDKKNDREQHS